MHSSLINHSSAVANWLALVNEAEGKCGCLLAEDLESYLVFLLQRYLQRTEFARSVLALDFLTAINHHGVVREEELRDVGDKCLLYAGLFPEQAQVKRITVEYFVDMGQNAYDTLSVLLSKERALAELYTDLCEHFLDVKDTLDCMRQLSDDKIATIGSNIVIESDLSAVIKH